MARLEAMGWKDAGLRPQDYLFRWLAGCGLQSRATESLRKERETRSLPGWAHMKYFIKHGHLSFLGSLKIHHSPQQQGIWKRAYRLHAHVFVYILLACPRRIRLSSQGCLRATLRHPQNRWLEKWHRRIGKINIPRRIICLYTFRVPLRDEISKKSSFPRQRRQTINFVCKFDSDGAVAVQKVPTLCFFSCFDCTWINYTRGATVIH